MSPHQEKSDKRASEDPRIKLQVEAEIADRRRRFFKSAADDQELLFWAGCWSRFTGGVND